MVFQLKLFHSATVLTKNELLFVELLSHAAQNLEATGVVDFMSGVVRVAILKGGIGKADSSAICYLASGSSL